MNNMLNQYITSLEEKDDVKKLLLISKFLENTNVDITDEMYAEIATNELIKPILSSLLSEINSKYLEILSNNSIMERILGTYCSLNELDIEIEEFEYTGVSDIVHDYLQEIRKYPLLDFDILKELFIKYNQNNDEESKLKIFYSNLRLVVSRLKKYYTDGTIQTMDLIQEGNLGLLRAIELFDVSKGFKFSMYATWFIDSYIRRFIEQNSRLVRIPTYKFHELYQYIRSKGELSGLLSQELSEKEISDYLEIPLEDVDEYEKLLSPIVSLNKKVGEEMEDELGDFIKDSDSDEFVKNVENQELRDRLYEILQTFSDIERQIIIYRFGLEGPKLSLEETTAKINEFKKITRQRVQQIEKRAKRRFRAPEILQKLDDFVDNKYIKDDDKSSMLRFCSNLPMYKNSIICNMIISGNYKESRKMLENITEQEDYFKYYGLLEKLENNYEKSLEYYGKCEIDERINLEIANLYIQLGLNSDGRKLLQKYSNFDYIINTIYLDILEQEYKSAFKLLKQIDYKKLDCNSLYIYKLIYCLLKKELNRNIDKNDYIDYLTKMVLNPYKREFQLEHIEQYSIFNVDYYKLLTDVYSKIRNLNGNHYSIFDTYKLHLDYFVGYKDGIPTKDVCVSTILGTKNVINVHPIILSDEYDLNDNLHSEILKQKRKKK